MATNFSVNGKAASTDAPPANEQVAQFRVQAAMKRAPSLEDAAADTSADREVDEAVGTTSVPPSIFSECGGIDVGLDTDRTREPAGQPGHDGRAAPARLGRRANAAEVLGQRVEGYGPEAAHPERRKRSGLPPAVQSREQALECRVGIGGGNPQLIDNLAIMPEHGSDFTSVALGAV